MYIVICNNFVLNDPSIFSKLCPFNFATTEKQAKLDAFSLFNNEPITLYCIINLPSLEAGELILMIPIHIDALLFYSQLKCHRFHRKVICKKNYHIFLKFLIGRSSLEKVLLKEEFEGGEKLPLLMF